MTFLGFTLSLKPFLFIHLPLNVFCPSFCTGISVVSEALRIAQDLQLNEDVIGVQDRLRQLYLLRQRGEENGRMPLEIPEGRMGRNEPFQEPRDEILQGYLEQLTRVSRSRS